MTRSINKECKYERTIGQDVLVTYALTWDYKLKHENIQYIVRKY